MCLWVHAHRYACTLTRKARKNIVSGNHSVQLISSLMKMYGTCDLDLWAESRSDKVSGRHL